MRYSPPKATDLQTLKNDLQRTGEEMADLFGVAGGQQWRKYTGGDSPREISPHILFFAMARLELDDAMIDRVLNRMRQVGATIDLAAGGEPEQ